MGTGILRTLIRQYLQTVPGVSYFADEHIQFGKRNYGGEFELIENCEMKLRNRN